MHEPGGRIGMAWRDKGLLRSLGKFIERMAVKPKPDAHLTGRKDFSPGGLVAQ